MTLVPFTPRATDPDQATLTILGNLEGVRANWIMGDLGLLVCEQYYTGTQPLQYMSKDLEKDLGETVTQLVINWPQMVADAYAERHVCTGFRYPSTDAGAAVSGDELWQWWQANNMDEQANMAQVDAISLSKAALLVGPAVGSGAPVITAESAFDVAWIRDPRSGMVIRGLKAWSEMLDDRTTIQWRNIYLPGRRITLRTAPGGGGWYVDQDVKSTEFVPLVPLVNRPRLKQREGRTEFAPIIPVANAANKMATDMMVSGEFHAMPRRWVFGLKATDFKNPDGTTKNAWSVIKGRLWATEKKPSEVSVGQFTESSLTNFHDTIKLLARLTAQLSGMPSDYMSFDSVNPPSADALRASERRMVKKCEDQQVSFGGSYETALRHAIRFATGKYDNAAMMLETSWRDPGTPTTAQVTDAAVKKVTTKGADGRPLVPTEQGRIDLGYTPQERDDMVQMEARALNLDPDEVALMALLDGAK